LQEAALAVESLESRISREKITPEEMGRALNQILAAVADSKEKIHRI
jgi:hypothetical protein